MNYNAQKIKDGVYLFYRSRSSRPIRAKKLLVRNVEADILKKVGFNSFTVRTNASVDECFKLMIPWGTVLEGTSFSKEDAKDKDLPLKAKALIALEAAKLDGYGKEWRISSYKRGGEALKTIRNS